MSLKLVAKHVYPTWGCGGTVHSSKYSLIYKCSTFGSNLHTNTLHKVTGLFFHVCSHFPTLPHLSRTYESVTFSPTCSNFHICHTFNDKLSICFRSSSSTSTTLLLTTIDHNSSTILHLHTTCVSTAKQCTKGTH